MDNIITFPEIQYELATLMLELDTLNDESLVDECNHLLTFYSDANGEIEKVISDFLKNGSITTEQRNKASYFYMLGNGDLYIEV